MNSKHVELLREMRFDPDNAGIPEYAVALDAAIAALSAPQPQPVNDNAVADNESAPVNDKNVWVLVPREPTKEMVMAGGYLYPDQHGHAGKVYTSMLASAPQPPAEAQGGEWINRKPSRPGVYGVRGFNLGAAPEDQFEAIVSVRLYRGELVCNLHESTSEERLDRWAPVEDCSNRFEWCEFLPAAPPSAHEARCTCPSGDGSLRWPCPVHPPSAPVGVVEALSELVDLMQGVIDGEYKPDSFTLQPARAALAQQPAAVDGAMVERIAALLHEEATDEPWTVAGVEHDGPDRDYYRTLARKVIVRAALAGQPAATLPDEDDSDLTVAYMAGRHDGRKEAQQHTTVDDLNAWRAAFVEERATRYREGGMAIEQARIHAETDAALMEPSASQQPAAKDGAWRQKAAEWLEAKAVEQEAANKKWPSHAACYKEWRDRPGILRHLAFQVLAGQQGGDHA